MKNFLIGFQIYDSGACAVNRRLMEYLPANRYKTHYNGHGIRRRLDCLWGILTADRIIISGIFLSKSEIELIHRLGKKFVYVMHGSAYMETGVKSPKEQAILKYASRIVSVSRVHADMIRKEFPQYAGKVVEWFNGTDWDRLDRVVAETSGASRDWRRIVLFGGGRHMKGNLAVCRAVEMLNRQHNLGLTVDVYGNYDKDDFSPQIAEIDCVNYKPLVPMDRVNHELAASGLFIANSHFETFNLSLIDAIGVGCDVLFSQYVGAKDVIPAATADDIISDPENVEEIKSKILKVISEPNNSRLLASIDRTETSWRNRAMQLDAILKDLEPVRQ